MTKQELAQKERDAEMLTHVLRLLCNGAEAIIAANVVILHAKSLASEISDPDLRRKVMAAAGKLKASNIGFFVDSE